MRLIVILIYFSFTPEVLKDNFNINLDFYLVVAYKTPVVKLRSQLSEKV